MTRKIEVEVQRPSDATCFVWGRFAWRRKEPRKPPDHLLPEEATAWCAGWDNEAEQDAVTAGS